MFNATQYYHGVFSFISYINFYFLDFKFPQGYSSSKWSSRNVYKPGLPVLEWATEHILQ